MKNDKSLKTKWDGRILCPYFDLIENTRVLNQEGLFYINAIAICYCVGVEKNAYTFPVLGLNKEFFVFPMKWPSKFIYIGTENNTSLANVVFCGFSFLLGKKINVFKVHTYFLWKKKRKNTILNSRIIQTNIFVYHLYNIRLEKCNSISIFLVILLFVLCMLNRAFIYL